MVSIENLELIKKVPKDFFNQWQEKGQHKLKGLMFLKQETNKKYVCYFYGAGCVWKIKNPPNEHKIGVNEDILFNCQSAEVDTQNRECSSTLKLNLQFFYNTGNIVNNCLEIKYDGPGIINNTHNCKMVQRRNEIFEYFKDIVQYAHETNFQIPLSSTMGFAYEKHMFIFLG